MSSKPKYLQIEESILREIESQRLKNGDQIPTEAELCEQFHVSRMTVNKAISSLTSKGYVKRTAGKGSFVNNTFVKKPLERVPRSFTKDMESIGMKAGAKLVDYRIYRGAEVPDEVASILKLGPDEFVHYFSRIRTGDDIIICLSGTYVPCRVLPALDVSRLERSFYEYVAEQDLHIQSTDLSISATLPTQEQKELLKIDQEALLKVSHTTTLDTGDLLEYIDTYYIGSMYTYRVSL